MNQKSKRKQQNAAGHEIAEIPAIGLDTIGLIAQSLENQEMVRRL
jgi:hypothetical protein